MVAQRPPGSRPQPPSYLLSADQHTFSTESAVELVVTDGCGTWPTFVGGGLTAF